ncbi:hypothetical protein PMZ80_005398 [Knufia obscura]|uniref:Uncharacterized protein n=1 Tax=Knufia obscura TaxID=1635080 RepID=A0ABR0RR18_9EURO|nr:hypothetical protein PMZ80_005398 [Knufia obscura]
MDRVRRSYGTAVHRPPVSRNHIPHQNTSFDHDSGLVYSEVEVSGSGSHNSWIFDYKTPSIVRARPRLPTATGARPLAHMALIKLGIESQNLTVEALQNLPWSIGERIWQQITDKYVNMRPRSPVCTLTPFSHAESFYIWRTFAIAFGSDFGHSGNRYMLDLRTPSLPLIEYYKGINSGKSDWLTCLRVSPKQITVPELVSISTINNLTVLDLSDGQLYIENRESTFDARIMRSWSELADAGRAFQSLRVLMLGWQEKIDTWIFDMLDGFPHLSIVLFTDCRWIHHKNHKDWEDDAWKHGWNIMPSKRGTKHLRSLLDDKAFYPASISNLHYESTRMAADAAQEPVKSIPDRPLLECWLGTPRPWRHVIDEFPGTRTVYLQKQLRPKVGGGITRPVLSDTPAVKREPSSPNTSQAKRPQGSISSKRRVAKHSAASLLAEMS